MYSILFVILIFMFNILHEPTNNEKYHTKMSDREE